MAGGLNKVQVIGNVGRDPELRYTPNGAAVASFSVAVSRRWTPADNSEAREETEWFNVVAWAKLAETCNQLVTKGRKVYIEGRLQTRSWEGQDGQKKYRTEVVAQTMLLLDGRPGGGAPRADQEQLDLGPGSGEMEPDDLPFAPSYL